MSRSKSPSIQDPNHAPPHTVEQGSFTSTLLVIPTHASSSNIIYDSSGSSNQIQNATNDQTGFSHSVSNVVIPLRASESSDIFDSVQVENDEDYCDEPETPLSENPSPTRSRTTKVRFRSRVRITSGISRKRKASKEEQQKGYLTLSRSSSDLSGSPSSSISAPLRTNAQEEVGKPGWGTLGQRVSIFARGNGPQRKVGREQRDIRSKSMRRSSYPRVVHVDSNQHNERTPLISHQDAEDVTGADQVIISDDELRYHLAREIDKIFGPWPNRLLNHRWWWWHIEPVVCCQCLTDSDDEG